MDTDVSCSARQKEIVDLEMAVEIYLRTRVSRYRTKERLIDINIYSACPSPVPDCIISSES